MRSELAEAIDNAFLQCTATEARAVEAELFAVIHALAPDEPGRVVTPIPESSGTALHSDCALRDHYARL